MSENKGMSSEELDKMTTEEEQPDEPEVKEEPIEQPAEETKEEPAEKQEPEPEKSEAELALEATEEPEEKPPAVDPKDAVIGGMRRELRDAENRLARAEGRLEAKATPQEPEKSPLELARDAQSKEVGHEVPLSEVVFDGKLHLEQRAWERRQDEAATQQRQTNDFQTAAIYAERTMTDAVHGQGLGLQSLQVLGAHLLTQGDKLDIYHSGKNCGKVTMERLKYRILQAGGANATELRGSLNARKTQTKPKTEEPAPKKKVEAPKPANEEDRQLRASTEQIMAELEFEE